MNRSFSTRATLAIVAFVGLVGLFGCTKRDEARCSHCGMKIDPQSVFRSEIVSPGSAPLAFDTPRCAILSFRNDAGVGAVIRVQEFYDRTVRDANDVRFVVGSDVIGPMGADYIPVAPDRTPKFMQDHAGLRILRFDEIRGDEWKEQK